MAFLLSREPRLGLRSKIDVNIAPPGPRFTFTASIREACGEPFLA